MDGSEWMPYQPAYFPTPPFPSIHRDIVRLAEREPRFLNCGPTVSASVISSVSAWVFDNRTGNHTSKNRYSEVGHVQSRCQSSGDVTKIWRLALSEWGPRR